MRGPKPKRKEIVWSADFAYGIGLMASDGCLSPDGRHLLFGSKDREQINNLKKALAVRAIPSSHLNQNGTYYRLQWGDTVLYDFLLQIGLTPRKSLTIGEIAIPDELFFDYFRGSLDGDGCFYSYYDPRWKNSYMFYLELSSASHKHVQWVREKCQILLGVNGHVTEQGYPPKQATMYQLKYAKKESLVLLNKLYSDNQSMCLSRKRLKIEKALGIVGKSLPSRILV